MVTYRLNYDGESKKGVTEIGYGNLPFKATVAGKPTSSGAHSNLLATKALGEVFGAAPPL